MNIDESGCGTIAVIIINYKTCDLLRKCLQSVLTSATYADRIAQIIVVDNASQDGAVEMVATEFPEVDLIALDENIGFTAANNLGLKKLGILNSEAKTQSSSTELGDVEFQQIIPQVQPTPDYVLLLNPDTELANDTLEQFINFMEQTPEAALCGAHLCYGSGEFQHGAFHFPSLAQIALDFFPLTNVRGSHHLHNSRFNGRYAAHRWEGQQPFKVDFVLGAAMFTRTQAITEIGGLDEGFFMYCEEIDWCMRLVQAGWSVYAVPTAHVVHYEGQSSKQVRWSSYVALWRSRLRFYAKYKALYPLGYTQWIKWLIKIGLTHKRNQARKRFARGEVTEGQLDAELQAYEKIRELVI